MLPHTTFDLYVSSPKILHCREIALLLKEKGIVSHVTQNDTIIKDGNKHRLEIGCKITGTVKEPKNIYFNIWGPLQQKFKLNCAYLNIHSSINGCIFDVFRNSNCPK